MFPHTIQLLPDVCRVALDEIYGYAKETNRRTYLP